MLAFPKTIIVFDTEYTSWEGAMERNWSGPNEYREIVQIGAVRVETETKEFREIDSFSCYVKPVKNPLLSKYFIDLTGIKQETVDKDGKSFAEALQDFYEWCGDDPIYSWGNDGKNIAENCELINLKSPFENGRFHDVRDVFRGAGVQVEGFMSSTIVGALGGETIRRGHDGLNDARSIVDALRILATKR